MSDLEHIEQLHLVAEGVVAEDHDESGGIRVDRLADFAGGFDLDQPDAHHAESVIVGTAVSFLNDHFALHAGEVGQAVDLVFIGSGGDGAGGETQGGRGSGGNEAGFGSGELDEALSDFFLEVVNGDEIAGSLLHGMLHFGEHEGSPSVVRVP